MFSHRLSSALQVLRDSRRPIKGEYSHPEKIYLRSLGCNHFLVFYEGHVQVFSFFCPLIAELSLETEDVKYRFRDDHEVFVVENGETKELHAPHIFGKKTQSTVNETSYAKHAENSIQSDRHSMGLRAIEFVADDVAVDEDELDLDTTTLRPKKQARKDLFYFPFWNNDCAILWEDGKLFLYKTCLNLPKDCLLCQPLSASEDACKLALQSYNELDQRLDFDNLPDEVDLVDEKVEAFWKKFSWLLTPIAHVMGLDERTFQRQKAVFVQLHRQLMYRLEKVPCSFNHYGTVPITDYRLAIGHVLLAFFFGFEMTGRLFLPCCDIKFPLERFIINGPACNRYRDGVINMFTLFGQFLKKARNFMVDGTFSPYFSPLKMTEFLEEIETYIDEEKIYKTKKMDPVIRQVLAEPRIQEYVYSKKDEESSYDDEDSLQEEEEDDDDDDSLDKGDPDAAFDFSYLLFGDIASNK